MTCHRLDGIEQQRERLVDAPGDDDQRRYDEERDLDAAAHNDRHDFTRTRQLFLRNTSNAK